MEFKVFDLGLVDFKRAWQIQKEIFKEVKNAHIDSALIICRHYPVFTLGRQGQRENILISQEELSAKQIQVYEVERGGDVTYHGPGQITLYPILNLNYFKKDIHWFLRKLEDVAIDFLSEWGIAGQRQTGLTGIWVGQQKIVSIGIAIRNWITFHGLSINVKKDDLDNFKFIRPCGMDIKMTSLETILSRDIEIDIVKESLIHKFRDVFSAKAKGVPYTVMMGTPFRLLPKTSLKD